MTTIKLLAALQPYRDLLNALRDLEIERDPSQRYYGSVSLSYHTIEVDLGAIRATGDNSESVWSYLQCTFEIRNEEVILAGLYGQSKEHEQTIRNTVLLYIPETGGPWSPDAPTELYSAEIQRYLTIAETIAKEGYACSSGDDYRPGYFSKMSVSDDDIKLEQINRWNSRSLNHKTNYHMRDLEFYIPLSGILKRNFWSEHAIGNMKILFNDRSSPNNRGCGERIMEALVRETEEWNRQCK